MNDPPNDDQGTPPDVSPSELTNHQFTRFLLKMKLCLRLNRSQRPFYIVAPKGIARYIKRFDWKSGLGVSLIGCGIVCGGYLVFCIDGGSGIVTAAGAVGGYLGMQSPVQPFNDIDPMNGLDVDMDVHHVGRGLLSTRHPDKKKQAADTAMQSTFEGRLKKVKGNDKDALQLYKALTSTIDQADQSDQKAKAEQFKDKIQDVMRDDANIKKISKDNGGKAKEWGLTEFGRLPTAELMAAAKCTKRNIVLYIRYYPKNGGAVRDHKQYFWAGDGVTVDVRYLFVSQYESDAGSIKSLFQGAATNRATWNWIDTSIDESKNERLPEFMQKDSTEIRNLVPSKANGFTSWMKADFRALPPAVSGLSTQVGPQSHPQQQPQSHPQQQPQSHPQQQPQSHPQQQPQSHPQQQPQSHPQQQPQSHPQQQPQSHPQQQPQPHPQQQPQSQQKPPSISTSTESQSHPEPQQQPPIYQHHVPMVYGQSPPNGPHPPPPQESPGQMRQRMEAEREKKRKAERERQDYNWKIGLFFILLLVGVFCTCVCAVLISAFIILQQREASRAEAAEERV